MPSLPDISGLLSAFQTGAFGLITVIIAVATMLGVAFMVNGGLMLLKASRGSEQLDWKALGGTLLIGTVLLQFVLSVNNTTTTVTGSTVTDYTSAMAYLPVSNQSSFWSAVLSACFAWVVAMGWAGVLRGFLFWKTATNGKSSRGDEIWRGATHLIGGAAAINIGVLLQNIFG
jgi:hypothetical protein